MKRTKLVTVIVISISIFTLLLAGCGKDTKAEKVTADGKKNDTSSVSTEVPSPTESAKVEESTKKENENTPTSSAPQEYSQASFKEASINEYYHVLDSIKSNITLNKGDETKHAITREAAAIMNWAVGTTLTKDEIKDATTKYNDKISKEDYMSLSSIFDLVYKEYKELLKSGQEQRIKDAGCKDACYPWSTEPLEPVEAIKENLPVVQS